MFSSSRKRSLAILFKWLSFLILAKAWLYAFYSVLCCILWCPSLLSCCLQCPLVMTSGNVMIIKCAASHCIFPTPLQQSVRHRPGRPHRHRTGREIRSQLWETIKGWVLIKRYLRRICVWVCVCCLCLHFNIYSFSSGSVFVGNVRKFWESNSTKITYVVRLKIPMIGGSYSTFCTSGSVCCHCVNVHQSIQPCLQSLILVIYSQAEQGRAFETAPGEQMKGKSSSSSRKMNTRGNTQTLILHTY